MVIQTHTHIRPSTPINPSTPPTPRPPKPFKHTKTVFDPDGYLRVLLGGPARLMQTKPPSDASLAALKALYEWRDRVRCLCCLP